MRRRGFDAVIIGLAKSGPVRGAWSLRHSLSGSYDFDRMKFIITVAYSGARSARSNW
jgi:hypothetical protein